MAPPARSVLSGQRQMRGLNSVSCLVQSRATRPDRHPKHRCTRSRDHHDVESPSRQAPQSRSTPRTVTVTVPGRDRDDDAVAPHEQSARTVRKRGGNSGVEAGTQMSNELKTLVTERAVGAIDLLACGIHRIRQRIGRTIAARIERNFGGLESGPPQGAMPK
jgi:hypothetical protein